MEDWNPHTNPNVIALVRQKDGNYKGFAQKNEAMVEVREIGPETALQRLLTHG